MHTKNKKYFFGFRQVFLQLGDIPIENLAVEEDPGTNGDIEGARGGLRIGHLKQEFAELFDRDLVWSLPKASSDASAAVRKVAVAMDNGEFDFDGTRQKQVRVTLLLFVVTSQKY